VIPALAITPGDPGGIGPEVILKSLAAGTLARDASLRLLGPASLFQAAASALGLAPGWTIVPAGAAPPAAAGVYLFDEPAPAAPFAARPTAEGGAASHRWVEEAIALAKLPAADPRHVHGVVTGPISKEAWALAGHTRHPGHTELFAERFAADRHAMMFISPRLNVILATVHIPLRHVPAALTTRGVLTAIELGAETLRTLLGREPRIAVCGLNPHAGEQGLLGSEDAAIIAPAIEQARRSGMNVAGPLPGDTVWIAAAGDAPDPGRPARPGKYDLVVAMYHDQGLAPLKLLARDEAVNVTVGLATVRTSPDHGTAFDIAGQGIAHPGSMRSAIELAIRLARGRQALPPQEPRSAPLSTHRTPGTKAP